MLWRLHTCPSDPPTRMGISQESASSLSTYSRKMHIHTWGCTRVGTARGEGHLGLLARHVSGLGVS
jgi:hypothetical protein